MGTEKDGIPIPGAHILQNNWLVLLKKNINAQKDEERLSHCSRHENQMQCVVLNWILDQENNCHKIGLR